VSEVLRRAKTAGPGKAAVGRWRSADREAGAPIDPSGTMPNGTPFATPAEFRAALLTEPWRSSYVTTVIEKLMTFGIGRGLQYYDAAAVREIMREAESSDFRWSSIIGGIVKSAPFQMRKLPDAEIVNAQN